MRVLKAFFAQQLDIYRQADQAMYEAKQISRNRVVTRSLMEEV